MDQKTLLRKIPSVETILNLPEIKNYSDSLGHDLVTRTVQNSVDSIRQCILSDSYDFGRNIQDYILEAVKESIEQFLEPYYRKAINATGIILHTGLGRAVLAKEALKQIKEQLSGYSLLQVDLETGERNKRDIAVEKLLCMLTGCQSATVVNNNAAATSIVLNTIANGKEVIISRGQLVEIGGSFRLPEVMKFSGAKMVEIGTTNKTHAKDYENAITENTAAILRVHPSNYTITGFTSQPGLPTLVEIAHKHNLVMIDDVGAGALIDFSKYGFEPEPLLSEAIQSGADIVTCSGDKLIGASQAGIIMGKKQYIDAVRKNQFARIVRSDKMTLAVLEATLKLFLDEKKALENVPTLQMLQRPLESLENNAQQLLTKIKDNIPQLQVCIMDGFSQVGSGSLPEQNLKTKLIAIRSDSLSAENLAKKLRCSKTPVIGRISKDAVIIDPRTLLDGDEDIIIKNLLTIFGND